MDKQAIADTIEADGLSGVLDVDWDGTVKASNFDQMRFTAEDHTSSLLDANSAILFLSTNSRGNLISDYDGEMDESIIHPGVFHFIPAGVAQQYDFKGRTTNIATRISPKLFTDLREQNPEFADVRLDEPWRGFTKPRLAQLVSHQNRLIQSGEMGWRSLAEANMVQLGVELLCAVAGRRPNTSTPLATEEVKLAEAYLWANLDTNVPLADIAELLGRDVFGFARAFKAATGATFHQFSMQIRLAEAMRLLKDTNEPIAEIAYSTGFSSQPHLTTAMKKIMAHTPGDVRRGR